jgi:hypothetical protein
MGSGVRRTVAVFWGVAFVLAGGTGRAHTGEPGLASAPGGPSKALRVGQSDDARWPRVYISDPITANQVKRVLDEATRLLAQPSCRALLDEFRDQRGHVLAERLAASDLDVDTYVSRLVFTDEWGTGPCARGALAVTMPGSRVVHVCGGVYLEGSWNRNSRHVVASYIHEILHTLGLGENPPSPSHITARVLARCEASSK